MKWMKEEDNEKLYLCPHPLFQKIDNAPQADKSIV